MEWRCDQGGLDLFRDCAGQGSLMRIKGVLSFLKIRARRSLPPPLVPTPHSSTPMPSLPRTSIRAAATTSAIGADVLMAWASA